VVGIIFFLFWKYPSEQLTRNLAVPFVIDSFFMSLLSVFLLRQGINSVDALRQRGLDSSGGLVLFLVSGALFWLSLMIPVFRKWSLPRDPSGGQSPRDAEVARAFARAAAGWGMTPSEARNRGSIQITLWLILGGFWVGEGLALLIILGFLPEPWPGLLYQLLGLVMIVGGLWLVVKMTPPGVRLLRIWWSERRVSQVIHLEGNIEDIWCRLSAPPSEPGNLSIVNLRQSDGTSKLLVAKSAAFQGKVPEGNETVDVACQLGTEAVLSITSRGAKTQETRPSE
jgi:hypothetical protein